MNYNYNNEINELKRNEVAIIKVSFFFNIPDHYKPVSELKVKINVVFPHLTSRSFINFRFQKLTDNIKIDINEISDPLEMCKNIVSA